MVVLFEYRYIPLPDIKLCAFTFTFTFNHGARAFNLVKENVPKFEPLAEYDYTLRRIYTQKYPHLHLYLQSILSWGYWFYMLVRLVMRMFGMLLVYLMVELTLLLPPNIDLAGVK